MDKSQIKIFGEPDENTLAQMYRSIQHEAVVGAGIMADSHKGYGVPIGGVLAYDGHISPSAVGYDIGCLAAGSRVGTTDGYTLPIETVRREAELSCWDGAAIRPVLSHGGCIPTGVKPALFLALANGRRLTLTADHLVQTPQGWLPAGELSAGDKVACAVQVGLPYEQISPCLPRSETVSDELIEGGLLMYRDNARLTALVRLLGVVCGDGHISKDKGGISIYTTDADDAAVMVRDFATLGHTAHVYTRARKPGYMDEIHVKVGSVKLTALFALLGAPRGRKAWPDNPMPWLFAMPAWVRAQFLSAFGSAECMTPRPQKTDIPNLQIKQAGENDNALRFIGHLLESLCFDVTIAPCGPPRGERRDYVLQVVGGTQEQVRYFEEIGFCYARKKRFEATRVASIVWQRAAHLAHRELARQEAMRLRAEGVYWKDILIQVAAGFGVSQGFVHHAIYDNRGILRRERVMVFVPDTTGEICWVPIVSLTDAGTLPVYDIATEDSAHCFFAEGIVVHNCGNKACRLDISADEVRTNIKSIMDDVWRTLDFGVGRKNSNDGPTDHPLFDSDLWHGPLLRPLKQMAQGQLGTIGSGNHYVDLFSDEQDRVWVGVHFGSRGLGHKTATHFLKAGGASDSMDAEPLVLSMASDLGQDYYAHMVLAGRYAYAGRDWVCDKVASLLGAQIMESVHNHHNFGWTETHSGREVMVVRKGATPAFAGQRGFVGGSMGDCSVILEGVASGEASTALHSTVHGAGRAMSRTQARGKINYKTKQVIAPGLVSREMMMEWIGKLGVELRGAGTDESPQAYKRLPEVLGFHRASVRVLHTLTPLGVAMAGENEHDPFKD